MKRKKITKIVACFIAAIMVFSSLPMSVFAMDFDTSKLASNTFMTSKTDYVVAPGVSETQFTLNDKSGASQQMGYALEVDLNNPYTSIVTSYKNYDATSWGLQTVRQQAAAAEKKLGVNVVAGTNGDYYNMQTGAPTGTFVMNNTLYTSNENWPYFAIRKDGKAEIGRRTTKAYAEANFKECIGGPVVLIEDGKITADAANADLMPRCAVGIKADGSVVMLVVDGRQFPTSVGQSLRQLAETMLALGCVDALNLDGGGSATFVSQHEGSDALECRNSPSDGVERNVSTALLVTCSAKPTGVFDHATLSPNNEVYTPGSTVQFTAGGVDSAGASVDLPADGKFALADSSFGTISDDGEFVSNGKTGEVVVNYISGGEVCGTVSIQIVVPDELYIPSSEVSLGFEETTDFDIVAKYKDRAVNMKAGDIIWSITDEGGNDLGETAGTFDGLTFTTLDGVTVNAIITATCAFDASVSGTVKAIIGAMPVVQYDFEYTTDKAEAEANPDLEWIPSYNMPRFDRSIGTSSPQQAAEFYEQGYPVYCWPNAAITDQESMKATVVSKEDGAPVRFGSHSLKIDYSYETYNGSSNANNYLRVTAPDHYFEGSPTALGCWVYIPEGTADFVLYLNCSNKDWGLAYQSIGDCNWTGWKYCEFDLTNPSNAGAGPARAPFGFYQGCGVFWISYQTGGQKGDRTASTIYLDNIQLVYGANTDDIDNPIISSVRTDQSEIVDDETVLTSNVNTFRASYADVAGKYATGIDFGEVKMAIDGVDVTDKCYINEGDEEIYFYDARLADGKHNIEISVADKFGNTTTETRYFTVDGSDEGTRVYLTPEIAAPILGQQYTLAIKSNDIGNVASADVAVKILSNFTTYWDKFTVVPGDAYDLAAPATYDSAKTTINFKAVKKDAAPLAEGDDIIAKIVFDIPTNVPEGLAVTYRVAKGKLTLVTPNEDEKYVESFSGKVTTECVSPYTLTSDIMTVGSDGGSFTVKDLSGQPAAGVNVYTTAGELIGITDADGKVFTDKYVGAVQQFQLYAEKDGQLSFIVKGQSYPAGGNEDGTPAYVKLNASENPEATQSISWMASPVASKDTAVVFYAEKSAYDENGESAFAVFNGTSKLVSMDSSANYLTNYAVRLNSALVDGLKANTEYVYKVGDGEKMSDLKTFKTTKTGTATNFFVIGDTQATDTTNTDKITEQLASSGVDYSFGIQTGDAVDNGGNYTMWSNIAKVFSGDFLGSQDLVQVLGNHETYGDEDASNATAYFNLPNTNEDGSAPAYYSVQYGNVYVAVINYAGVDTYKEAAEWLKKDAAKATANWKILTMHQPAYFTNPSGTNPEVQTIISQAADAAGIDVVFAGHDHSYARTEPLKGGKVDTDGTVYYICGSTGEKSYEIVNNADHHYAALESEYNAIYLTVKATDTTLSIDTHDYTAGGDDILIDSYEIKKDIKCTEGGAHDYAYADGFLKCKVCGYVDPVGTYTGFATDAASGRTMYFLGGKATTGWFSYINDCYYFDENGLAVTGTQTIDGISGYKFTKDGKQIGAVFVTDENGITRAYRGGTYLKGWYQQNGYWYYFSRANGEMRTGETTITYRTNQKLDVIFSEDGRLIRGGFYTTDDGTMYYWGPDLVSGWQEISGDTYYFSPDDFYMATDNTEIDGKMYAFDMSGVLMHEGEHNWKSYFNIIDANCTVNGKRVDVCEECGSIKTVVTPAPGHVDADGDGNCDVCNCTVDFNSKLDNVLYNILNRLKNLIAAIMKIIQKNQQIISAIIPD